MMMMNYWPQCTWQDKKQSRAFLDPSVMCRRGWNFGNKPESPVHGGGGERILALEMKVVTKNTQLLNTEQVWLLRAATGEPHPHPPSQDATTHLSPHTLVILGSVQRLLPLLACIQLLS